MSAPRSTLPDVGQEAGPIPNRHQWLFLRRDRRFHAFISGIGAGKTVAGIIRMVKNVRDWNPGRTGYVIAPTVPSMRAVIIPELEKWGILEGCEFNRTEKRLEFPNGSTVLLESADNDRKIERLRGPSIAWFWMDEAATIDKRAWDIMIGRLRAGDYLNAFVTTTPKGYNWVHDRFIEPADQAPGETEVEGVETTPLDDAYVIQGVPSHANPHLPDEYESITAEYEGKFYAQEVLGEFVGFEGLVYPWFDLETHVTDVQPRHYDETIYGLDWGFNSPSAILAIVRGADEWQVTECFYARRCTTGDLAEQLRGMEERWGPGPIYCDPAEPSNIEQLSRAGLAAKSAENAVTPGIQHVSSLRDRLTIHSSCQSLINEFRQYRYRDDDDHGDTPVKENDHALDALRYGLFSHDSKQGAYLITR